MLKHFFGLDVLRFFSAVFVVLFHFGGFGISEPIFPAPKHDLAWPELYSISQFGWVGVQIFFVISGFVIAASLIDVTTRTFLIRRVIRVAPALWIYCTIGLCIRLAWGEPATDLLGDFFRSIFCLL